MNPLRLYSIVRMDLNMGPGKVAAQCGHAYLDAYLNAHEMDKKRCNTWKGEHHGIKICLEAKNLDKLEQLQQICIEREIPHALITDLGYTCFDGVATVTVLGIGPIYKSELEELRKLKLMK